ncbi:hypothetical protein BU26DRAFT_279990 [Trematosphaeria pertusa]|uniref:Uncharacterized protein n=1 Tax=Trematosphaeria pertusa TaxID=390896 RepID=A0A6A6IKZ6_9PLEO|nr:uncharacterized protein BU26DRAFT_279990 [Trematosphaeria pertusa]KAF2251295.1 hypothetical protein BU26DRAFT_279990 [Trematosphaeria pertusa]
MIGQTRLAEHIVTAKRRARGAPVQWIAQLRSGHVGSRMQAELMRWSRSYLELRPVRLPRRAARIPFTGVPGIPSDKGCPDAERLFAIFKEKGQFVSDSWARPARVKGYCVIRALIVAVDGVLGDLRGERRRPERRSRKPHRRTNLEPHDLTTSNPQKQSRQRRFCH